jgi:hypothetical protein
VPNSQKKAWAQYRLLIMAFVRNGRGKMAARDDCRA